MTADNPTTGPVTPPKGAARLRIIGVLILLLGLGGAGLVYWTGASPEDASADPATARDYKLAARNEEINFGKVGVLTGELLDDLKHPGVQAVLIVIASGLVASGCFYVARLMTRRVATETVVNGAIAGEVKGKK